MKIIDKCVTSPTAIKPSNKAIFDSMAFGDVFRAKTDFGIYICIKAYWNSDVVFTLGSGGVIDVSKICDKSTVITLLPNAVIALNE